MKITSVCPKSTLASWFISCLFSPLIMHSSVLSTLSSLFACRLYIVMMSHIFNCSFQLVESSTNKIPPSMKIMMQRVIIDLLRCPVNSFTDVDRGHFTMVIYGEIMFWPQGDFLLQCPEWPLGQIESKAKPYRVPKIYPCLFLPHYISTRQAPQINLLK